MRPQPQKQSMVLFLLGDPTSGKSTHGAKFARDHKFMYCDVGTELNKWRKKDAHVDRVLKRSFDKGYLVPTELVRKIYRRIVMETPQTKGLVFGGNPKMLGEAKFLHSLFNKNSRTNLVCLYLTIPAKEIFRRTKLRPGYSGKEKRVMDTPKALQNRLAFWSKDVARVVKYWQGHIPFMTLSSNAPTALVHRRLEQKLKPYLLK